MSTDNEYDIDQHHDEELGEVFNLKEILGDVKFPSRQSKGKLGLLCSSLFLGAVGLTATQDAEAATFAVANNNDSGTGSLREAIGLANGAAGADIIDLSGVAGSIVLTSGDLDITDDVTITGPGAANLTIDGNAANRIFDVNDAGDVSISGLTLSNGRETSSDGGGIDSYDSDLTLTNLTISNNYAYYDGGGVAVYRGSLVVDGCTISGNLSADGDGGGIACYSAYGGITIDSSTITGNTASDDGGGVAVSYTYGYTGVLKITDSTISNNEADGDGGGLYVTSYGIVTIDGSTISGNTNTGDDGGGIWSRENDTLIIKDSYIQNNYASSDGGGVYAGRTQYQVSILDSTISGNIADSDGGGVAVSGNKYGGSPIAVTINNSDITGNTAFSDGGGLVAGKYINTMQITDSDISNNYSDDSGGGIYSYALFNNLDLQIAGSTISGNTANSDGGGISIFSKYRYGGVSIQDSQITNNIAGANYDLGDPVGGGGFSTLSMVSSLSEFEVRDSEISGNTAVGSGGGLSFFNFGNTEKYDLLGSNAIPQFFNSTISNNESQGYAGGGISIVTPAALGSFVLDTCTVSGNIASGPGGGIDLYAPYRKYGDPFSPPYESERSAGFTGALKINSSTISSNVSGYEGGGVSLYDEGSYNEGNSLTITDSTISGNTADDDGGGVYFGSRNMNLVVKQSTLSGNEATNGDGGGASISTDSNPNVIQNSTITGNSSGDDGGGLYNNAQRTNVLGSIVSGNTATYDGPDLYTDGANFDLNFSLVGDTTDASYDDLGNNQFNVDPLLGPLADNGGSTLTHLLLTGSPAIDAGLNFSGSSFDQRGAPFIRSEGDTDIGSTEFQASPVITSAPSATPNPAFVGDTVTFGVAVTDNNAGSLTYDWDFGDGSTGTGAAPTHAYTTDSTFTVTVTVTNVTGNTASGTVDVAVNPVVIPVTPTPADPLLGVGLDSDGDGFSDDFETAAGTDPNDASSTPFGTASATSVEPLSVKRLVIKLKRKFVGLDAIRFIGFVPVPAGFDFTGQRVTVDIGGVARGFTLDSRGRGQDGAIRITFSRPRNGQSRVILVRKFKGDFQDTLNTSSNLNDTTALRESRIVRISLTFNNVGYATDQGVIYNARPGVKGIAKNPRR